eukprot:764074-Hanusia_phi.AAC.5
MRRVGRRGKGRHGPESQEELRSGRRGVERGGELRVVNYTEEKLEYGMELSEMLDILRLIDKYSMLSEAEQNIRIERIRSRGVDMAEMCDSVGWFLILPPAICIASIHSFATGFSAMDWSSTGHRAGIIAGLVAAAALVGILNLAANHQVRHESLMQKTFPAAAPEQQLYQVGDQEYLPLNEGSPEDMAIEIEKIMAKEKVLLGKIKERAKKHQRVEIRVEAGQVRCLLCTNTHTSMDRLAVNVETV